ncbi:hypothetical protein [uncultured Methylobacterium sp.]|uniref:hypothetical protein n=1 Tax=uncultured Methylobacterium sp. TaxID=157278 RepID=UPI002587B5C0|nr:hypothetical protein [uncultured Methylobacterium sp.]
MRLGMVAILIAGAALSACSVREANLKMWDNQRPANASERAQIVDYIRNNYLDPYSIRDAEIAEVLTSTGVDARMYGNICVNMNAKNSLGAYTGRQYQIYYFNQSGKLYDAQQGTFHSIMCSDKRVRYSPFKELERLSKV